MCELLFLFQNVLPDLRGRTLVDVGSRLGAVLYGVRWQHEHTPSNAHIYTHTLLKSKRSILSFHANMDPFSPDVFIYDLLKATLHLATDVHPFHTGMYSFRIPLSD